MRRQRMVVAGLVLFVAVPLGAQQAGSVEIGGFGQFVRPDYAWHVKDGLVAGGGRIGVFFTPRWQLEGDASVSSFTNEAPRASGSTSQQTLAARLNYNIPFGSDTRTHHLIAGIGVGAQRFDGSSDFSFSPGAGFRFMLGPTVALRLDGLVEWVENRTAPTFQFPTGVGVNEHAARSTNLEIRVGLSLLTGYQKLLRPAVAPVVPERRPEPEPRSEPAPAGRTAPPPAAAPPRENRDSIDAVNRAREALVAAVLFDYDRSEVRADQAAIMNAKLPVLRANPSVRIRIEGNADDRGSDEYNMALGMRRAEAAKKYLMDHGIEASRIDIASFGEERAVCRDEEESCWVKNRRDEFVIVAGGATLVAPR
jgi:peptidoglycan-associated lipoprotein